MLSHHQLEVSFTTNNLLQIVSMNHFTNITPNIQFLPEPASKNSPLSIPSSHVSFFFVSHHSRSPHDQLTVSLVKPIAFTISPIFLHIINTSFHTGTYPDALRIAKVTPIFKKGDKTEPGNYRPIAILPTFTKVIEKLLLRQLESYCKKNSMSSSSQYGFINRRSMNLAILNMTEKLKSNTENKILTLGIFVDLTKAFDLINHSILLDKLHSCGICGVPLQVLESYLKNRKQSVIINNNTSCMTNVTSRVSQGSLLGPLVFWLFINDYRIIYTLTQFYTDDTNIFIEAKNVTDLYIKGNCTLIKL